jgi:FkbM family methyltransferase
LPILNAVETCSVISFEASPTTLPFLSRTVLESVYRDRWTVVGKAVASRSGVADFVLASPSYDAFEGLKDTGRAGDTGIARVPVTTIDEEWELRGRPRVSAIKIDIEGGELLALRGGDRCLRFERPYVLLEWTKANLAAYDQEPKALLEYSEDLGFRVFSLPNLVPVDSPDTLAMHMAVSESFLLAPAIGH